MLTVAAKGSVFNHFLYQKEILPSRTLLLYAHTLLEQRPLKQPSRTENKKREELTCSIVQISNIWL